MLAKPQEIMGFSEITFSCINNEKKLISWREVTKAKK
jgi:hypothetical protein